MRIDIAAQTLERLAPLQDKLDTGELPFQALVQRAGAEAVRPQTIHTETVQIDIGSQQAIVALEAPRLGEQGAVLGNQTVTAEDDVGCRFADAGRGIDV